MSVVPTFSWSITTVLLFNVDDAAAAVDVREENRGHVLEGLLEVDVRADADALARGDVGADENVARDVVAEAQVDVGNVDGENLHGAVEVFINTLRRAVEVSERSVALEKDGAVDGARREAEQHQETDDDGGANPGLEVVVQQHAIATRRYYSNDHDAKLLLSLFFFYFCTIVYS
jgi:hypothetical protein